MNKPIYETIKSYGDNLETTTTKIIVGYERVTRSGLSHKKKPISMIKALEVRDRIYHNQQRVNIKNELFAKKFNYPKEWELHRAKVIDEASGLVALNCH
ncbi:hypothetical protein [Lactococcus lactis]|jgi:AAA+ ATPase superfamily predicted ATPase|uniref:hypothetical protein n=1 Tax=Lactococcus lactis TaxID=1358 RepID=UPI0016524E1B|nr:hypothetical protein [Lactococcus lactis]QNL91306.1 hypothetical protein HUG14_08065 [Lactococcus lactis]